MTCIQWLYRARNLETEIIQLQETYEREFTKATKGVSELTGMTVSGTKDNHKTMERLAELSEQIDNMRAHRMSILHEVLEVIETAPKPNMRMLLRYRFISSMSWKQISEQMHYSDKHIKRIYKRAIEEVRPAIEEKINVSL